MTGGERRGDGGGWGGGPPPAPLTPQAGKQLGAATGLTPTERASGAAQKLSG